MAVRIAIEPWPDVRLTSDTEADIGENGLDGGHIILRYQRRPWSSATGSASSSGESSVKVMPSPPRGPVPGCNETCTTRFVLGGGAARGVRIERAGRLAGYAYISAEGHVGPLAIAPDADSRSVVITALRCALVSRPSQVSMIVPGRADGVMQAVLALGFRIKEPYVLMASRPFGDWRSYLPRAPGFM